MRKILIAIILAALAPAWGTAAELRAGAAKGVITPARVEGRILTTGYPAEGVVHDIYARVLVLDDGAKKLVIVTYDLNCLDVATPILRSRVLHELGIDPAYLLLLATHNHDGPIQIVPGNFDYGRWLADKIFALIEEAIAHEQGPVRLYFGSGPGDFLRSDPRYPSIYGIRGQPLDVEVQVLKVMMGERVLALLFNQPTHPMHGSSRRIGVAHPGYAVEELEARYPGATALYADACGGDQFIRDGYVMIAPLRTVKKVGHKLAETVERIAAGPMTEVTGPISSRMEVLSLPLAPPISYDAAKKLARQEKAPLDLGFVPYPHPDRGTNWIRAVLQHYEQGLPFPTRSDQYPCTDDGFMLPALPEPREFPCRYEEVIVAKIGPMPLVAMQGEVCAPIGLRIKNALRDEMPIMVFAYMGEHNLYLPTRELVVKDAYQSRVIQTQYASPAGWAPEVEDEMIAGVVKMIEATLR